MNKALKFMAAGLILLASQVQAAWSGAYFVDKVINLQAYQSITGNPVVEVCQVTLSNGKNFAFYNKGATQEKWIDLLTMAMSQGKKVQVLFTAGYDLSYLPRFCGDYSGNYVCTSGGSTTLPSFSGVSLERL